MDREIRPDSGNPEFVDEEASPLSRTVYPGTPDDDLVDGGRVFPITYNVADVVEGYETLKRLATSPRHIVPGHDPLVLARYPAAGPGLEGWIARLDVEPANQ